jgi:tetratricopeptide (TPR) repeat protein
MLGVRENQLRSWEAQGWIAARDAFGWQDLIALRSLQRLRQSRVPPERIAQALAALRGKLAEVENPLRELRLVSEGRRIVVLIDGQKMEPVSGQLLLDFDAEEMNRLLAFPGKSSPRHTQAGRECEAEQWFQTGVRLEEAGAPFAEIIAAYQRAVDLDPASVGALVNLGTAHFHRREWAEAERCYQRALEADPSYALAHFNLANLYDERGDGERAQAHYEKALELNATYADAHYNLALLCQRRGLVMKALRHWKAYLKLDPASSWAVIARRELDALRQAAVVPGTGR